MNQTDAKHPAQASGSHRRGVVKKFAPQRTPRWLLLTSRSATRRMTRRQTLSCKDKDEHKGVRSLPGCELTSNCGAPIALAGYHTPNTKNAKGVPPVSIMGASTHILIMLHEGAPAEALARRSSTFAITATRRYHFKGVPGAHSTFVMDVQKFSMVTAWKPILMRPQKIAWGKD